MELAEPKTSVFSDTGVTKHENLFALREKRKYCIYDEFQIVIRYSIYKEKGLQLIATGP